MKTLFFILALTCSACTTIGTPADAHRAAASTSALEDVQYDFDQNKLEAAEDAFHFLRSYVDYFYLLVAKNSKMFSTQQFGATPGWCVGDGHPENFGALLQKDGSALFTMNDMDDAGPCPVVYDLLRFMTASNLYSSEAAPDRILNFYLDGLRDKDVNVPAAISDILKKSVKRGEGPDSKKISKNRFVRTKSMTEVATPTYSEIQSKVQSLFPTYQVLDIVRTAKVGGGSGGLTRYEVLIGDQENLRHIELKQEVRPSISPVATSTIPATDERLQKTVTYEQGNSQSPFYGYARIGTLDMLVRPRFHGDVGVSLDKQSLAENLEIIYYEAYILGRIHRRSVADPQKYAEALKNSKQTEWWNDVTHLVQHIQQKYNQLKMRHATL